MTNFNTRQFTRGLTGDSNLKAGSILQGRYQILGVLGVGGMGSVYQARDMHFPNVSKLVAIKEMLNLASDPTLREMIVKNFEREANLLATLNHPSIPEIHDTFTHQDRSYLVMEFIDGKDLEAILAETPGFLPETQIIDWAIQLCDVLTYLHGHKPEPIVFRDMKPSNVMIDHHGHVRLIDFGIAKGFQVGQKGTMIGTEGYSPPEQYRGEAGPTGDIYAMGATLHHLLTKKDPRLEPPFSFGERSIRKINTAVTEGLDAVVNQALAYGPADRFPSAAAMKDALINVRNGAAGPGPMPSATLTAPGRTGLAAADVMPSGRTGLVAADARSNVVPLWAFKCEDEVRGQPLVVGRLVYVGAYDHNLYAVSRAEGKFAWKYAAEGGFAASPIFDNAAVFIGAEDGKLYAITAETGRQLWSYTTGASIRCTARAAHGHVFVGSDDAHLHAVSAQNGHLAWRFEAIAPIRSRPAMLEKEGRVLFGCESGEFYCVDFSGTLKWRFRCKRAVTSSPALTEGLVIVGCSDWNVYALEASSGWTVWKTRTEKPIVSSPALTNKFVYIGSADGHLYSLDVRSGKVMWKFETGDQVASSPALYNTGVYFGSVDGHVYCVEAANGKLRWKFKTDGAVISSPTVIDDVVYIGSTDHNLYAIAA